MRHVSDSERRARLATRHALANPLASPELATRALTVLHATEPATVYLSLWARVVGLTVDDVDRALYRERTLAKQLAMRRTLFVFPLDLLPAVLPSASARVALTERARLAKDVLTIGLDGGQWLDQAHEAIVEALAAGPLTALELRKAVPLIDLPGASPSGGPWASRVLVGLGATGDIVRGDNDGGWRTSRPRWTLARDWLGSEITQLDAAAGYAELVRRYLYSFGPATEGDIVWWLGATKGIVRAALASVAAVPVELDSGQTGYLLPDDLSVVEDPGHWVALLPVLDPTIMGWQQRDFYLGSHSAALFEARGNAGTTAWVNGRAVGCWVQDAAGVVTVHLLEEVSAASRVLLDAEAERLTAWLDGAVVGTGYVSPAMRAALGS